MSKRSEYWSFRENVTKSLMEFGVPLRPAELAVIDMSLKMKEGKEYNLTPKQTAMTMIDDVRRLYNW